MQLVYVKMLPTYSHQNLLSAPQGLVIYFVCAKFSLYFSYVIAMQYIASC